MEEKYARLQRFFNACDELVSGSYMNAEPKISEVLKSVAASRELLELFTAMTEGYDFPAAKSLYLRASGSGTKLAARLPADRHEVLAYVFCLLVELDAGEIKFSDFLLRYFYVDGSYTASYSVFSERLIRPFRDIVRDFFPETERSGAVASMQRKRDELFGQISEALMQERARISALPLLKEDSAAGDAILSAAGNAAERRDGVGLSALLTGYNYFLRYIDGECDESKALYELLASLRGEA